MRKVMRYECKRLLWNRFFVGLVLVLLFYGWQVLGRHHHPGGGAHGALFPLELWGLSEPDGAAAVGWGAVFSHLLHLPKGAPRSIADRRRPDASPPLRAGPAAQRR